MNNIIRYSDLQNPSLDLDCILRDLIRRYVGENSEIDFEVIQEELKLIFKICDEEIIIDFTPYVKDTKIVSFAYTDGTLTIVDSNESTFSVNIGELVFDETITVIQAIAKGFKYKNENEEEFLITFDKLGTNLIIKLNNDIIQTIGVSGDIPSWISNITETDIQNWNNSLKNGDNISSLVNNAGYITEYQNLTYDSITGVLSISNGTGVILTPSPHTHPISDIIGLQDTLNSKENSFLKGNIIAGANVDITGNLVNRLVGTGNITIGLDFDLDDYYTKTELQTSGLSSVNWGNLTGNRSGISLSGFLNDLDYLSPGDNISELVNDVGYITDADLPEAQILSFNTSTGALALSSGNTVNLDGRYSLLGHTHTIPQVTGLQAALDGKFNNPTGTISQVILGNGTYLNLSDLAEGSVTSVGLSMPTGFTVTNSPIKSAGVLTVALTTGRVIPLQTDIDEGKLAYSWGDHSLVGYALLSDLHNPITLGTANGLSLVGQQLSLALATTTTAGALSGADKLKLDGLTNYTHPTQTAISVTGTGTEVISSVIVNTLGHTTEVTKRSLTLADLGYTAYSLPIASSSVLGGVKIGSNISISGDGTISVAAPYVHPTQTAINHTNTGANVVSEILVNTLGHVTGISTRVLSLTDLGYTPYTLPIATATVVGGVRVGTTLSIDAGTGILNYNHPTQTSLSITTTGVEVLATASSNGTGHLTTLTKRTLPTANGTTIGVLSAADWTTFNNKQALLVSGTNIKTINGNSLLGAGNLAVGGISVYKASDDTLQWTTTDANNAIKFAGAGDTTISFNTATRTITINSIPGSGGGGAVTSFNGRTGGVSSAAGDYNLDMMGDVTLTSLENSNILRYDSTISKWVNVELNTTIVPEGINLYFTNTRARTSVSLTTTGNSGAATYNNTTGIFNIPNYTLVGLGGQPLNSILTSISGLSTSSTGLIKLTNGVASLDTGTYLTSEVDPKGVSSIAFSGTSTKTLTITLRDSSTITGTFTDIDTTYGSILPADLTTGTDTVNKLISAKTLKDWLASFNYITAASIPAAQNLSWNSATGALGISGGTGVNLDGRYLQANQTITLTGNVTGSGTTSIVTTIVNDAITTAKILNSNVTYAKIQNVTGSRILGRFATTAGPIQEITLGAGLVLNSTTGLLTATGLEGTVTSVSTGNLSPLFTTFVSNATSTPSITFSAVTQAGNLVYASAPTATVAIPSFRSLVELDIPSLSISKITDLQDTLDGKSPTSHTHALLTNGTGLLGSNYNGSTATTWSVSYGTTAGTSAQGNDSRIVNGQTAFGWGNHAGLYSLINHNHTLDSLSNVTITSNTNGEILKWNGTAWINNTLAEAGIASVSHSHATLTRGTGLTGTNYDGSSASTFAFDTVWGDTRYGLAGDFVKKIGDTMSGALNFLTPTISGLMLNYDGHSVLGMSASNMILANPTPTTGGPVFIRPMGRSSFVGELVITSGTSQLHYRGPAFLHGIGGGAEDIYIRLGLSRTASGNAYIDLIGDTTHTQYGLRIRRYATGENAPSEIIHRGTGTFSITTQEAAGLVFLTTGLVRGGFLPNGNFVLQPSTTDNGYKLQIRTGNSIGDGFYVEGKIATTSVAIGSMVKIGTGGVLEAAVAGTDYLTSANLSTNFVTTDTTQTGLSGNKTWTGQHIFQNAKIKTTLANGGLNYVEFLDSSNVQTAYIGHGSSTNTSFQISVTGNQAIQFISGDMYRFSIREDGELIAGSTTNPNIIWHAGNHIHRTDAENDGRYVLKIGDDVSGALNFTNDPMIRRNTVNVLYTSSNSLFLQNHNLTTGGNVYIRPINNVSTNEFVIMNSGNLYYRGTSSNFGYGVEAPAEITVGKSRTVNGSANIDLIGDTVYSTYGLRLIRGSGENAVSQILHRGTSYFQIRTLEAAAISFATTSIERAFILANGNVIVGASSTDNGGYKFQVDSGTDTGNGLRVRGSGLFTGDVTHFSDRRLKKNITLIKDALTKVHKISGNEYLYRDKQSYGLIAQEVQEIMPYAISTQDTNYLGLNYNAIHALTVEAIKELDKKKADKEEIEKLKERVKYLEDKLGYASTVN